MTEDHPSPAKTLRIDGSDGERFVLDVLDEGDDVLLAVDLEYRGFRGATETWVLKASWGHFVSEFARLAETRRGLARLESISPNELCLEFKVLDAPGHVGLSGVIGQRGQGYGARLTFDVFRFDPSILPGLARAIGA